MLSYLISEHADVWRQGELRGYLFLMENLQHTFFFLNLQLSCYGSYESATNSCSNLVRCIYIVPFKSNDWGNCIFVYCLFVCFLSLILYQYLDFWINRWRFILMNIAFEESGCHRVVSLSLFWGKIFALWVLGC